MADETEGQFVYVRLKEHGSEVPPGRVSRKAYDDIWSGKGYVIVGNEEAELLGSPATMMETQGGTSEPASVAVDTSDAGTTTRKRG